MSEAVDPDTGATSPPGSTRRGVVDAGATFVATVLIGLVSAIVLSRTYGATVIGEFALVSAPWTVLVQLSNLGEQLALIRLLASEPARSPRTTSTFLVVLGFSMALTLGVALVVAPVSVVLLRAAPERTDLVAPAMALLVAYVVVDNASWNGDRLLIAIRRAHATFVVRILQLLVLLGASMAFAGGSPDVWGLTYATLLSYAFGLVARSVLVVRSIDLHPSRSDLRAAAVELPALLRFGVRIVPGGFAGGLAGPASTWMIGLTRSADVLGAYSRAAGLSSRLQEASYRINDVLLPALSRWCTRGEYGAASREFSRLQLAIVTVLAAGCASVAGASHGLLSVFGPDFTQADTALGLLVFAYSAAIVAAMHHMFLLALGEPAATSQLALLRTGVTLSALVPLVLAFGSAGAGAAALGGYGLEVVMATRRTARHLGDHGAALSPVPWGRLALATLVALTAAWATDSALPSIAGGVAGCLVGFGAFVVAGASLRLLPRHDVVRALREQLGSQDLGPEPSGTTPRLDGRGRGRVTYVVARFPKVTETFVYEELHALRRLGFDVRLLALVRMREGVVQPRAAELADLVRFGRRSPLRLAWAELWWAVHRPRALAGIWWRVLRWNWRSPGELVKGALTTLVAVDWARALADDPPDHVHAHFATWAAHGAYVTAGLLDVPYSFTGHAHDVFGPNRMLEEKLARARFVVVISDYERRLLAGRYPRLQDAMHVVHCGIDLDGFPRRPGPAGPPEPAGPTSLLCIASLNGYKGHPVLLQACAELRRRGRSLRCTLVGDGPDRAGLEASARRLGIADAVRFTGFLAAPEVRRLLLESDIVVQPSVVVAGGKMEGIPVALMEALAARRPVVASALSGVPELVRDGETGLLVPPGDAEALATAIGRLLDDPALRDRLGRAGRDLVEQQFDVTVSARRLATLLTAPPPEGRGAQATTVSDGSDVQRDGDDET